MSKRITTVVLCALLASLSAWIHAACADKSVRASSPCITRHDTCNTTSEYTTPGGEKQLFVSGCGDSEEKVFNGDFQCDIESTGEFCHGNANFVPCFTAYGCWGFALGKLNADDPSSPMVYLCIVVGQGKSKSEEKKITAPCPLPSV